MSISSTRSSLKLPLRSVGIPLIAMATALAGAGLLMTLLGYDALAGYRFLIRGSLGSVYGVSETLIRMTPLLITGLGVGLAFRSGVWNIGGEGQIYLGALGAVWLSLTFGSTAVPILIIALSLVLGFVGGALWGGIAGTLRAVWDVNEVITTIMLNYVAILLIQWVVRGPLREASGWSPMTDRIAEAVRLPTLLTGTRLHAGILVGLGIAGLVYFLLWKTTLGYKLRAAGENATAARYGGIKVRQNLISVMLLSGGLAGVAGAVEVAGVHFRLIDGLSPGFGYTAVIVALLGRRHPLGIVLAAFVMAVIEVGARTMETGLKIPFALTYVIQALMVLCLMGGDLYLQKHSR